MESRLQQVLIALLLAACGSVATKKPLPFETDFLENGDLIYRYGNGFFSSYFQEVSDSIKTYSHVGFVDRSEDSIFVIHSEASELTGVGYVQRQPLEDFMKDVLAWGIYRLDRPQIMRDSIVALAMDFHRKKVPFDLDFSNESDDKLYCTELIAKCINRALKEELVQPNTEFLGGQFYSVDDTFLVDGVYAVRTSGDEL